MKRLSLLQNFRKAQNRKETALYFLAKLVEKILTQGFRHQKR